MKLPKGIKDRSFIVQGFGAVGYWAAKFLERDGAKITTIVEYNSAIHNADGINVQEAKDYMTKNGTLKGFPGAKETELSNPLAFLEK